MTTTGASIRFRTLRRHPLAAGLAALCAASVPFAVPVCTATTTAEQGPPSGVQALAARFGMTLQSARLPSAPDAVVTNCDDSGPGSLRDAVDNAPSGDTIDLTQLTCSRITLTTGSILFGQHDLGFVGPGRGKLSIDASGSPGSGAFRHLGGGTLFLSGLTIENGLKYLNDVDTRGGCIYSNGNVTVERSALTNCEALAVFPYAALGGAIYSYGSTYLLDSRITGSSANSGAYATGGGVLANGGFQSNYAQISGNQAFGENSWGGGVFQRGPALIINSEISGNLAGNWSGVALEDNNGAPAVMLNSTVSGNVAQRKVGGVDAHQPIHMYSSTVAFNSSTVWNDGNGHYFAAGVDVDDGSSTVYSSILSNNTVPGVGTPGDIFDLSGNALGIGGADDIIMEFNIGLPASTDHGDPGLQPLQDNGGPTRTQRPTSFNAGYGDNILNLPTDQRGAGFPRNTSIGITIGAYEQNPDVIFINGFD